MFCMKAGGPDARRDSGNEIFKSLKLQNDSHD